MDFYSITSFFSNSVSKAQSFILGTDKKSPPSQEVQKSSTLDPPHEISRLKNLEKKLSDSFCEASDYVKGFGRGINPTSSLVDPIQSSLKIQDSHCSDGQSFNLGQKHGAITGLAADALNVAAGATTDGLSLACEGISAGTCTLAAAPAAALATTQVATGALMAVGHGANYLEAKNNSQKIEQRSSQNVSEAVEKPRLKNPGKSESPIWKKLEAFREKTKTNGLKGKDLEYYQWDHTHNDIEVYTKNRLHKGSMDPITGKMIKPAVKGRLLKLD